MQTGERRKFRDWLAERIGDGPGQVSQRELARRLAARDPVAGDPETFRRNIAKILSGKTSRPTKRTRESIQAALEDWSAPNDDEDSAITREMVVAELRDVRSKALRLERAILEGHLL